MMVLCITFLRCQASHPEPPCRTQSPGSYRKNNPLEKRKGQEVVASMGHTKHVLCGVEGGAADS